MRSRAGLDVIKWSQYTDWLLPRFPVGFHSYSSLCVLRALRGKTTKFGRRTVIESLARSFFVFSVTSCAEKIYRSKRR
jgi:hypothetical protein